MTPMMQVAYLLIHLIFDTYISIVLIRMILQKVGASWSNPISQFIIQITEKPLSVFRKWVPGYQGFDFAMIVFAILLELIKNIIWLTISGVALNPAGLVLIIMSDLISKLVCIYLYTVIINAVLSWIPQLQSHPVAHIIYVMTEPVLSRCRKIIPLIAGIDFSPLIAILALTIINILITQPLYQYGMSFMLGNAQ